MSSRQRARAAAVGLGLTVALGAAPREAAAFCGFYVTRTDDKPVDDATRVVLMRDGPWTVLSMQASYRGPPGDFAMVVPVPHGISESNVKTLPREVFDHLDALTAPRLVELWEQDPCAAPPPAPGPAAAPNGAPPLATAKAPAVQVEARYAAGEYEVVLLSAEDSAALESWLHRNGYRIPDGAEPLLRQYVQEKAMFFVAKVDAAKLRFENGRATLSPLRFHFYTETFSLPLRLGVLSSAGTQDLVVSILARGKRYEVANAPNVTIPTNYDVAEAARAELGAFYAALFDRTLAQTPGAVVTEYASDPSTCDACPAPPLDAREILALGADAPVHILAIPSHYAHGVNVAFGVVASRNRIADADEALNKVRSDVASCYLRDHRLPMRFEIDLSVDLDAGGKVKAAKAGDVKKGHAERLPPEFFECVEKAVRKARFDAPIGGKVTTKVEIKWVDVPILSERAPVDTSGFVLTRLHARYDKDTPAQDLVFREAPPIEGGREEHGALHQAHGARPSAANAFQARYAVRHPWTGPIACKSPRRGVWGGPPPGVLGTTDAKPALGVAFAPRGQLDLASLLREDVPELKFVATAPPASVAVEPGARGCGSCGAGAGERALPSSIAAFLALLGRARRRRRT